MMESPKIKLFELGSSLEDLEWEVNYFCKDKIVQQITYHMAEYRTTTVMVVYREMEE